MIEQKIGQQKCYAFGKNLGIAFQLQDDYLDAFGDPKTFGKQVGGDILENKKTYLFLKAMELGSKEMKAELKTLYESSTEDLDQKIATTLNLFEQSGATETTKQAIQNYTQAAFDVIETIEIEPNKKQLLRDFGSMLMTRTS